MKILKRIFAIMLSLLIATSLIFVIYAGEYYKAEDIAFETVKNSNVKILDDMVITSPTIDTDTCVIFYPGAKVEYTAYIPLMQKLSKQGISSVILKMPLNFAFLGINRADEVYELFPEVENFYIMGHSLGGGMASAYAESNQDKIKGLIVLGAYVYGDYPTEKSLTVYGTFNSNLEKNIDYKENIVVIDGGNHAQFGNYGKQKGDPNATITAEQQQNITVNAIIDFISN